MPALLPVRRRTLIRSAQAVAAVAIMFAAFRFPIINDVATSLDDPPTFRPDAQIPPLPESFKRHIRAGYPGLTTLHLDGVAPAVVAAAAVRAAARMPRWQVAVADGARLEGVATTRLMRFRDDFTFRFRPATGGGGTVVDGRSRSRVGKGDFGANAARIESFFRALKEEVGVGGRGGGGGTARL